MKRAGPLLLGLAVVIVTLVLGVPAIRAKLAEHERSSRLRAALESSKAFDALSNDEVRAAAAELGPRWIGRLREKPGDAEARHAAGRLLALDVLDRETLVTCLEALFELRLTSPRRRFHQKAARWIGVDVQWFSPDLRSDLLRGATADVVVKVDGQIVNTIPFTDTVRKSAGGAVAHDAGAAKACGPVGKHVVEATLTVEIGAARALIERRLELETLPGSPEQIVTLVDDAPARELAATIGLELGDLTRSGSTFELEHELHLDKEHRQRRGDFMPLWFVLPKPLPFWLCHRVAFEIEGKRYDTHARVELAPGTVRGPPWQESHHTSAATTELRSLAPGRHPVKIILEPDAWLLGSAHEGDAFQLYGGKLVFERTLVVEAR